MKTGIIVAMDREYDALLGAGLDRRLVVKAGIGKVNAAMSATKLITGQSPDCIISSGVAGGLDPCLQPGDFVLGLRTAHHDVWCGAPNEPGQVQGLPRFFEADAKMVGKFRDALLKVEGIRVHEGLVCTGDCFLETEDDALKVRKIYPDALACDMESAAIAQVCHRFGVPFLSFRAISDVLSPGSSDHQACYDAFWSSLASRSFEILRSLLG